MWVPEWEENSMGNANYSWFSLRISKTADVKTAVYWR